MIITGVMYLWLQRSKTGRAIRATSMDIGAAQLAGVRVAQIFAIVYGLGAGLAGVAGTLISLSYSLNPSMGQPFLIKAFVVCVLGGLGSVEGALVGGLAYGVVESFASQIDLTIGTQHISGAGLQDAVALLVLLIVLILRPTGIMGRATA
jgi:branched-chain amino acid transport system permease protein